MFWKKASFTVSTSPSPLTPNSSTRIPFIKMHGLGNDFVVLPENHLNGLNLLDPLNEAVLQKLARFLCDRHFGIGADGLILAGTPSLAKLANGQQYATRFVYLNGDGSWAEMCGNGIRCFARFVYEQGIVKEKAFIVETLAGPISPSIEEDGNITVNMGCPVLTPGQIPFNPSAAGISGYFSNPQETTQTYAHQLSLNDQQIRFTPVSMGNPHCIIFQDEQTTPLVPEQIGPVLEVNDAFPAKTNVEFVTIVNSKQLKVTVWERGCGFTLACGTGACATVVAAVLHKRVDATHGVTVELPGGCLRIQWSGKLDSPVYMTGSATTVFSGRVIIPESL
jgi:diaminopimelate epimerase